MKKIILIVLLTIFFINYSHAMFMNDADSFHEMLFDVDILPEIMEIKDLVDNGDHGTAFFKMTFILKDMDWFSNDDLEAILESLVLLVRNYNFYLKISSTILLKILKEESLFEVEALKALMFFLIQKGCDELYPIAFNLIEKVEDDCFYLESFAPILYVLILKEYKPALEFFHEKIVDDADDQYIVERYYKTINSFYSKNKIRTLIRTDFCSGLQI